MRWRLFVVAAVLVAVPGLSVFEDTASAQEQVVVAAQAGRTVYQADFAVRTEVDALDPIERVAILTPGGPVVVELSIFLDGKPFRIRREALVDELLSAADKNGDGTATWEEAISNQRFVFGRVRAQNPQQLQQLIKNYDANGNGVVDRFEVRRFIAMLFQGSDFWLAPNYSAYPQGATLLSVLDTDKNDTLSADEIRAAPERLKSRDANDDDLLVAAELSSGPQSAVRIRGGVVQPAAAATSMVLLGPLAQPEVVHLALKQRYGEKETLGPDNFKFVPGLFALLDKDKDGTVSQDEILGLNEVPPQMKIAIQLGKVDAEGPRLVAEICSESLQERATVTLQDDHRLLLDLGDAKFQWAVSAGGNAWSYNYEASAKQLLARYDVDKNNYLEAKEMEGNLRPQFDMWDIDGDGKVYAEEIVSTYERQTLPMKSQVRVSAAQQGDPLYQALDANGDGMLSVREILGSAARLNALDKNGDGKLAANEVPPTIRFDLGTGADNMYGAGVRVLADGRVMSVRQSTAPVGPDWFIHMDRNGDGDITLREFLGTEEQFQKLDTDGDGFVDRAEAEAATAK